MAKKNKQPKEKKHLSKGKKWLIALSILVLIAIIVVVIVVFIPKNVNDVKLQITAQKEKVFLLNEEDNKLYSNFQTKINSDAKEFSQEVIDVKEVVKNINVALDFYSSHMAFAQDNNVFQAEYKTITNGFNDAINYENSIINTLTEVEQKVDKYSATYLTSAWRELKISFNGYFKAYSQVFEGLGKVFVGCLGQGVINNDFSKLVVKTLPSYYNEITIDLSKSTQIVKKLTAFTNKYLLTSSLILNYNYSTTLQSSVRQIDKFEKLYNAKFQDVIKTAATSGFTFAKLENDTENVLENVKVFLSGGLSA